MTKRMLIDATHAEETRVVVLDGGRVEDYDVETANKKQLKGNIYLAKVVRVEPSLQAAFVEYGGNRHGFLAFDEIHPDYYQIPVADRDKLLALQEAEERAAAAAEEAEAAREGEAIRIETRSAADTAGETNVAEDTAAEPGSAPPVSDGSAIATPGTALSWGTEDDANARAEAASWEDPSAEDAHAPDAAEEEIRAGGLETDDSAAETPPETLGGDGESAEDLHPTKIPRHFLRQYKIQEVIHRRQIVLVQVVKEERGAKGAALTTYVSLAGRYCVLMPNSPRGGGVSRKITGLVDRKRLKEIIAELAIPPGMGLIVRTAGANRPKPEIRRDCEYLIRLWDEIRDTVMKSVAPALVYEEASLIKRAIRDVYSRDIEEVLVDGDAAWQTAREFMRTLLPTHARKVVLWNNGGQTLFAHEHVEAELDGTLSPTVPLRSGGSLVINQAEALVAIDVNSGRSTRERNVEETALRTNLEAAEEVARQLRLRDLAGLIVIDFIDMEARKHNAMVERRLKEALKGDRARVQVGRISHFGLLEMSRQRLHPSLDETSFSPCPHCGGTGHVRSVESSVVHLLRALEDEAARKTAGDLVIHAASEVALYVLNHKRSWLAEIEARHDVSVSFAVETDRPVSLVAIERLPGRASVTAKAAPAEPPKVEAAVAVEPDRPEEGAGGAGEEVPGEMDDDRERRHHRRRRRRRHDESQEVRAGVPEAAPITGAVPPELADQPEVADALDGEGGHAEPEAPEPRRTRSRPARRPRREPGPRGPRERRSSRSSPSEAPIPAPSLASASASQPEPLPRDLAETPAEQVEPLPQPPMPVAAPPADRVATQRPVAAVPITSTPSGQPAPAGRPPVDDRPPAPAVVPVLVGGEQDQPPKKKRGWWHA